MNDYILLTKPFQSNVIHVRTWALGDVLSGVGLLYFELLARTPSLPTFSWTTTDVTVAW